MLCPILLVQLLQQSKICPSSVFNICHTRQTSPQVIFTSLDHSEGRWEASLSGPTKRCSRRCVSGCAFSQKTFFFRGIHALPKRRNTCMERNGDYVEKWSHFGSFVFNKLRDKKYLRFSFDSPPCICPLSSCISRTAEWIYMKYDIRKLYEYKYWHVDILVKNGTGVTDSVVEDAKRSPGICRWPFKCLSHRTVFSNRNCE